LLDGVSISHARGKRLDSGLFRAPGFESADVIHIASHAEINLDYPELARLTVSTKDGDESFLTPLDLRGIAVVADLVVLSACETTGVNTYSFDSNLGFVSAFLQSGAGAVVATLWPVADGFAAEFVLDFYAAMVDGVSPPEALAQAKRRVFAEAAASGKSDWPAFQIYIN
jgi:CHAT domain-containing protein